MSASLKNQQGFSLPEVMVAMVLMVMIVTALSGFQRGANWKVRNHEDMMVYTENPVESTK